MIGGSKLAPVTASKIEPFYKDLGNKIQARRKSLGLSQDDLASALDPPVTRASIANIEAGKQRILTHTLVKLADVLDVEVSSLLSGIDGRSSAARDIEAKLAEHSVPTKTIRQLLKTSQRERRS
jgi:transcriptional regulator with XRE-family HTH domain